MYNCQSCCDSVVDIHDGIISNVQLAVISEWISPVSNAVYLELNIMTQAKNLILYTREGITVKTCMKENFDLQSYSYRIQQTIYLRCSIERLKVTNRNFKSLAQSYQKKKKDQTNFFNKAADQRDLKIFHRLKKMYPLPPLPPSPHPHQP